MRYDMLCFEGIAMNLNIFLGRQSLPNFRLVAPPNGDLQTVTVKEDVSGFDGTALTTLTPCSDVEDTAILLVRCAPQHHFHTIPIRVFHRVTRQATPESCTAT